MSTPALTRVGWTGAKAVPATGWLRGPAFDLGLIVGVLALALLLGGAAAVRPSLFGGVLLVDLWLLAYPHVASTFTRVAFDRESARTHRLLLLGLPPLVLAATAGVAWLGGVLWLNTLYYTWQSWHYTRQSYGIARAYRRISGHHRDPLGDVVIFVVPLWGLVHRAHQRSTLFYGMPLWLPPAPRALALATFALALGALGLWIVRKARAIRSEGPGHALFVLSHVVITVVSYVAIPDITRGWLFINIWHNAQYLLFVWAQNARRFRAGLDPARPFLSRLSQPEHAARYAAVCLGLSTAFYLALGQVTERITWSLLPVVLVCHLAVNFHHYLVDAVIWRSPRARREKTR